MFLYAPFTFCPSTQVPYTSSPRGRYFDALARLRAAEASYLSFRAIEHEEEALTHRLRELQLRKQENQLRTLGKYFSGDAHRTHGLNDFGPYQENDSYMVNLAEHQAFRAGHDCCCCDSLASSMYPCTYCSDASIVDLHLIRSSSPVVLLNKIEVPKYNIVSSPRFKSWIPSSLDDVHHSTGVKLPLSRSQTFTPTSSFSRRGRRARSFRRPYPYTLQHAFNTQYHGPWDNEQQKSPPYNVPLYQALSISKPHSVDIMSGDELFQEFSKLFDTPTTHGHQTDEPTQYTSGTVPSHAETPECNLLDRADVANAPPEPDAEGEAKAVSSVCAETASSDGELDIQVPTASTIPSANPSSADPPAETTSSTEITSSFDKIRTIEATFNALKENFTLPAELDFLPSTPSTPSAASISTSDSDTESTSATDHLTYSHLNRPVRSYEQALTVLLEQLDGVESLGDADVRKSRREVVKRVELALEELEREVDGRWRIRVLEPLAEKVKVGDEVESNGAVLGLGLDEDESEGQRKDDMHNQNGSDDRADAISGPMPEIIEQNDSSTANSSDDVSASILTTPAHGNNPIQATSQDQFEFSDASSVVDTPTSADHTIDPVEVTDSIPSPVLIASTTNSFPGGTEPGPSISSTSSVLEPAPIFPSNADAIVRDHEVTILDDIPPKSAVESPTPSSLARELSSTINGNTGFTTVRGADVEPEGFFLTSCGADESVFEHPIARDSDEDWLEVDV